MQPKYMIQSMTRRAFGRFLAVGVGAGIALAHTSSGRARSEAADPGAPLVYAFYPLENGKLVTCTACLSHARNKRFATLEAAKANRAHAGCNCSILQLSDTAETYTRMFGGSVGSPERLMYDLRHEPVS